MLKTLACLVGAMTAASALLGWIDPHTGARFQSRTSGLRAEAFRLQPDARSLWPEYRRSDSASSDTTLRLARSLVADDVMVREGQWRDVEILAGPVMTASAPLLAATANRDEYHFHIGLKGRPTRTSRWSRQEAFAGYPHTVRIQVARREEHQPTLPSQWHCVRALFAALDEAIAPAGMPLPVRLQAEWAQVYAADRTAVHFDER